MLGNLSFQSACTATLWQGKVLVLEIPLNRDSMEGSFTNLAMLVPDLRQATAIQDVETQLAPL